MCMHCILLNRSSLLCVKLLQSSSYSLLSYSPCLLVITSNYQQDLADTAHWVISFLTALQHIKGYIHCVPKTCDYILYNIFNNNLNRFYRAMHFSAKRGIAIACRLSVCPSVRLSVTLVNCDHIGWNSSKIILPLVSLERSLFATPTWLVCSKGNIPKFSPE